MTRTKDGMYEIDMSQICELCHELIRQKCEAIRIKFEYRNSKTGEDQYYKESKAIFDKYYELITNTLCV